MACAINTYELEEEATGTGAIIGKTGKITFSIAKERVFMFKVKATAVGGATVSTEKVTIKVGCGKEVVTA